ncbi:MAG: ATP-dependent helicase HrpB [candidate division FCPU426 bacterium]
MPEDFTQLPVYPFLKELAATLAGQGLLLLDAEPGAGKTTLVPWRLLDEPALGGGKILLLEPRRLAARAAADRIAGLLGERPGQTAGLRTRLETLVSSRTRLEVVTEGVLTRMLQADPALEGYSTIIFDEFHTRSLHGDLGLALAWDARRLLRPDLRLAVMSATLPAAELQAAYGPWPLVKVPGRCHEAEVRYRPPLSPREKPWEAAVRLSLEAWGAVAEQGQGTVLCFLPGYREMFRTREILSRQRPDLDRQAQLLHGRMPPEAQRAVLDPGQAAGLRLVFATNVAETSLTIPGVRAVVDIGLERRVRFSPRTGMDHWETVPISQASAEQRKGRAGRLGPGICFRWWDETERRPPFAPPEIQEADLSALLLETAVWGAAGPAALTWLTQPPEAAVQQARSLLGALGLLDNRGAVTPAGRRAAGLGLHPRLSRMVQAAEARGWSDTAIVLAALLETQDQGREPEPDLAGRLADWKSGKQGSAGKAFRFLEEEIRRLERALGRQSGDSGGQNVDPDVAGRTLLLAYPDRAAMRTRQDTPNAARYLLASGRGALVEGPLSRQEFLAVAELDGGEQDARIFLAAAVTRQDLESGLAGNPVERRQFKWEGWTPVASLETTLGAIVLRRRVEPQPDPAAIQAGARERLRQAGLQALPWNAHSRRWLARCRFVERWGQAGTWPAFSDAALLEQAEAWLWPFGQWSGGRVWDEHALLSALEHRLGWERRRQLDQLAPESWTLPSGSRKRLGYETQEVPVLSGRLQEFFGTRETPRLCGQALMLDLLSPANRTVQLTRDLDGFWDRAYPEVRKELRGRYPRHPWPEDPRAAQATARTKKSRRVS